MTASQPQTRIPVATILRAAGVVTAALALLDLVGSVLPFVGANQLGLFAAVFLLAPGYFGDEVAGPAAGLPRREALRVHARHVGAGLLVSAVVLAGFVPGFGLWMTALNDWRLAPSAEALGRPADRFVGEPTRSAAPLDVFAIDSRIVVELDPPSGPWTLDVRADGPFVPLRRHAVPTTTWSASGDDARPVALAFVTRGANTVWIEATVNGAPLTADAIAIGAAASHPHPDTIEPEGLRIAIGHRWMIVALLVQLLLIALPEEAFFRGYLQARLGQHERFGRRWNLPLGLHLSPAIVATSAIFAVVHFVVGFAPARLAVFFPSLLFGWLRDRTGGILAPIVLHAACNLMVQLAHTQFLPQ